MQVPLIMSVIGRDRPGLVESIARIVAQHGGNWLESRMCRLGGEFAGILRIHIDSAQETVLRENLQSLEKDGLSLVVCSGRDGAERIHGKQAALELVGQDRPGIVREISHALAHHGVNVEELATECTSAPMSGEALFKATARVTIPDSCALPELRKELERIAGNLLVELSIEPIE